MKLTKTIFEEIMAKSVRPESENEVTEQLRVYNKQTVKCINDTRLYSMQDGYDDHPIFSIDICGDF